MSFEIMVLPIHCLYYSSIMHIYNFSYSTQQVLIYSLHFCKSKLLHNLTIWTWLVLQAFQKRNKKKKKKQYATLRSATDASEIGSVSFRCSFDFAESAMKFNTYSLISDLNSSIVEEQLPVYWLPHRTVGLYSSQLLVAPPLRMPAPRLDVFLYTSMLLQVWPPLWPQNSLSPLLWKKNSLRGEKAISKG